MLRSRLNWITACTLVRRMNMDDTTRDAADLLWLAFLLTGQRDISLDIAVDTIASQDDGYPFFTTWMGAWARRTVIAKALGAIRGELAESAHRTRMARVEHGAAAPQGWSLSPETTKARIEEALLSIDVFPRAAVVLSIFEAVRMADAAVLLDADASLVRKAQAIGLSEFIGNLAGTKRHAEVRYACPFRLIFAAR